MWVFKIFTNNLTNFDYGETTVHKGYQRIKLIYEYCDKI